MRRNEIYPEYIRYSVLWFLIWQTVLVARGMRACLRRPALATRTHAIVSVSVSTARRRRRRRRPCAGSTRTGIIGNAASEKR